MAMKTDRVCLCGFGTVGSHSSDRDGAIAAQSIKRTRPMISCRAWVRSEFGPPARISLCRTPHR